MIQYKDTHTTVFQSAIFQTNSTVLQTADFLLVVDPALLPEEIKAIQAYVEELQAVQERPVFLLFTHSHYDHLLGYKLFSDATVIASKAFAENPDWQQDVEDMLKWDEENFVVRSYPIEYPEVDLTIEKDGQTLEVGETSVTFYQAPGHNKDGIFAVVEPVGVWLVGDYLSEFEFPLACFSSLAYENTLSKVETILAKHDIHLLVPGHGVVATDRVTILKRRAEGVAYLQELRHCLASGKEFDMEKLWQRYKLRRGMQKFHDENVEVIKKELSA